MEKLEVKDLKKLYEIAQSFTNVDALVVDDDPSVLESTSKALKSFFRNVYTAKDYKSGNAAFTLKKPQIVFIDILMPGKSGLELADKLKKGNKNLVIVMITASDELEHIAESSRIGVDAFIPKPLETEKLLDLFCLVQPKLDNMRFQTTIVTTLGVANKIVKIAEERGVDRSDIVHNILKDYVDNYFKKEDGKP